MTKSTIFMRSHTALCNSASVFLGLPVFLCGIRMFRVQESDNERRGVSFLERNHSALRAQPKRLHMALADRFSLSPSGPKQNRVLQRKRGGGQRSAREVPGGSRASHPAG